MPAGKLIQWVQAYQPCPEWALWSDVRWDMEDFPLIVAQYDHVNWVKGILRYIEEKSSDGKRGSINRLALTDHHKCRFGRWYYGRGMNRYQEMETFINLEPLHISVHQCGIAIVQLCDEAEFVKAKGLSTKLLELKNDILEHLAELQRQLTSQ